MLYGINDGDNRLIVAAADDATELTAWQSELPTHGVEWDFVGVLDMLSDPRFTGFKKPPILLTFPSGDERDAYAKAKSIELCLPNNLRDRQRHMIVATQPDRYATRPEEERGKTLAELHGLTDVDPWDQRTEEQKAFDAKMAALAEEMRKKGELTGSSFGDPSKAPKGKETEAKEGEEESDLHIRKIEAHRNGAGGIVVTGITAVKPSDEKAGEVPSSASPIASPQPVDPTNQRDDEDPTVPNPGIIAVFHRVTVVGAKLADIVPVLEAADIDLIQQAKVVRNNSAGCWAAMPRQLQAEKIVEALTKAGFTAEHRAIREDGEIILPKGTKVVEGEDVASFPRPWNAKTAGQWGKLDDAAREEETKKIKGVEFIFCMHRNTHNRIVTVWIAPKLWWDANKTLYPESLPIKHLLPGDLDEVEPGLYQSSSRDEHMISHDLHRRGFKESLRMQMDINLTL